MLKSLGVLMALLALQGSSSLIAAHDRNEGWWRVTDDRTNSIRFAITGRSEGVPTLFFYDAPNRTLADWRRDIADGQIDQTKLRLRSYCKRTRRGEYRCYTRANSPGRQRGCAGQFYANNLMSVRIDPSANARLVLKDNTRFCENTRHNPLTCARIGCDSYMPLETIVYRDNPTF